MEEKFDLMKSYIDSMHDQIVNHVEITDNNLIFHYDTLEYSNVQNEDYYNNHCKFCRCDLIFKNIDVPYAEIKAKNKLRTSIRIYYIDEFLDFIKRKNLMIQTLYFYIGYGTVYIDAILVSKKNKAVNNCYIVIPATEVSYEWK